MIYRYCIDGDMRVAHCHLLNSHHESPSPNSATPSFCVGAAVGAEEGTGVGVVVAGALGGSVGASTPSILASTACAVSYTDSSFSTMPVDKPKASEADSRADSSLICFAKSSPVSSSKHSQPHCNTLFSQRKLSLF